MKKNEKMKSDIEKAKKLIKGGKLVVYPTDTLYGIGADALNENAIKKVYDVKKRPYHMPISIAVSEIEEMNEYGVMNALAYKIAEKFLPGALTIIVKKRDIIPDILAKEKIGIRIPASTIARKIARGMPITATSANLHGGKEPVDVEIARHQLGNAISLYIDNGRLSGVCSTIIDVSEGIIKIIREGAIKREELYGL